MINWFNHLYPYTNLHELNLDWVIATVKHGEKEIADFIGINTIKYADPILWNIESQYEANTVVVDGQTGNAYISVKAVPSGVHLNREEYWTQIYNYANVIDTLREQIAHNEGESTTATQPYLVDDLVFINGVLYRVIAPMIAGDSFVTDSNVVQTTINAEIARLHGFITTETSARESADTTLQNNINAEASARESADDQLQTKIDILSDVIIDVTKHGVSVENADNATYIQTLLNEYAGKGVLFFPEGTYKTGVLNLPSNTHIILHGELKLKDNANSQLIQSSSTANIMIEGDGSLNGNKANQESALAIACIIFGDASSTTYNVNNVLIKGITIKNALYWGACVIGDNITFEKVTFANNNYMSFIGPHSKNGKFIDCVAYGVIQDWGLGFYGGVDGGLIDNCIAYNNNETGLGALSDAAQPAPSNNIKITNCTCYGNQTGIACGGWSGVGHNIIISNNYCHNATNGGIYEMNGVFVSNTVNGVISDNILIDNSANETGSEITLIGENTNINISGNVMKSDDGFGVLITGAAIVRLNVSNNIIKTPNTISYNSVTNCVNNVINDNTLDGNIYIPFADEIILRDNTKNTIVFTTVTFTPDGTKTEFTIPLASLHMEGNIENVIVMPIKDYGQVPLISWSNTQIIITYTTAPPAGYGSLAYQIFVKSDLY